MKEYKFDPSLNILYKEHNNLDYIFNPKTIAVIGASEKPKTVGRTIFENLINSADKREIFAINPKRDTILGHKSYKNIKDVPKKVDLVVIATPSITVPQIIKDCEEASVCGAIIVSAGFKELGKSGQKLEDEIKANQKNIRIIGPNCLGIMSPNINLNATFAKDMAKKGNIAFISQSGALGTAVLDWSLKENIGLSSFVSIGSMIDVDWGDLINYFGDDPDTRSILIYMENVSDARSFLSAAREVALTKPIILIKAGKTNESAKAAKSHTGALMGSSDVFDAALKRVGVLRVDTIEALFSMAEIFSKQPITKGPNLAIVTNAGGPGVIATDSLILNKAKLATLSDKTYQALNQFLPNAWSHNNPIDILGDATPDLYFKTVETIKDDPNIDGILVILTPQFMTEPTEVANKLKKFKEIGKPIFGAWMGADSVEEGRKLLSEANIPCFEYPDVACVAFAYMYAYNYNLMGIYETPTIKREVESEEIIRKKHEIISAIIKKAREENRTTLNEVDSKKVLKAFEIPIVDTHIAKDIDEAVNFAKQISYPVVLKLFSNQITHKTDVGGVKLNLNCEDEVKKAFNDIKESLKMHGKEKDFEGVTVQKMITQKGYELILGCAQDAKFGPTLLFGTGGQLVEVFKDKAIGIPPLTSALAKRLMERTKVYKALKGVRGQKSINLDELEKIIVNFSNLIAQFPEIKEFDINPLLATSDKILALDARIILYKKDEIYPKLAIRPYPIDYVTDWKINDKIDVIIRPIISDDEPLVRDFYQSVSEQSLRQEYLRTLHYDDLTAHERLIRICYIDYDREITLVTEIKNEDKIRKILAIARFSKLKNSNDAAFSLLVKDTWQNMGIGKELVKNIIKIAKVEKIDHLLSHMFEDNQNMKKLCESLNFSFIKLKNNIIQVSLKI